MTMTKPWLLPLLSALPIHAFTTPWRSQRRLGSVGAISNDDLSFEGGDEDLFGGLSGNAVAPSVASKSNENLMELPLLDLLQSEDVKMDRSIVPMPTAHLPSSELSTPFVYGLRLDLPIHQMILFGESEEGIDEDEDPPQNSELPFPSFQVSKEPIDLDDDGVGMVFDEGTIERISRSLDPFAGGAAATRTYGHLIWRNPNSDSLVGAIGCASEVLLEAPNMEIMVVDEDSQDGDVVVPEEVPEHSKTALCRATTRFKVVEVVSTIPYPVVKVETIADEDDSTNPDILRKLIASTKAAVQVWDDQEERSVQLDVDDVIDEDDDDDDDDDDVYIDLDDEMGDIEGNVLLDTPALMQRIMQGTSTLLKHSRDELDAKRSDGRSLLEQSMLEDGLFKQEGNPFQNEDDDDEFSRPNIVDPLDIMEAQLQELLAVWEVFQSSLVDDIPMKDRPMAVATVCAELAGLYDPTVRRMILVLRNERARLVVVAAAIGAKCRRVSAAAIAQDVTSKVDESQKELTVGVPRLPGWAKSLKDGTRIEYFWSEIDGWVPGTVVGTPLQMPDDELLVEVRFDDDSESSRKLPLTPEDKIRWRPL